MRLTHNNQRDDNYKKPVPNVAVQAGVTYWYRGEQKDQYNSWIDVGKTDSNGTIDFTNLQKQLSDTLKFKK